MLSNEKEYYSANAGDPIIEINETPAMLIKQLGPHYWEYFINGEIIYISSLPPTTIGICDGMKPLAENHSFECSGKKLNVKLYKEKEKGKNV